MTLCGLAFVDCMNGFASFACGLRTFIFTLALQMNVIKWVRSLFKIYTVNE